MTTKQYRLLNILRGQSKFIHRNSPFITLLLSLFALLPTLSFAADFSVERELQTSLMQSKALISIVAVKQQAAQSVSGEIVKLKDLAGLIRTNHQQLSERFVTRSDVVERLGGVALQRHNLMSEQYLSVLADYLIMVESLGNNEIPQLTLENLRSLLENFLPKREQPILGSLPYKKLRLPARAPLSGPAITPAYLGGNKTVSEADLASTAEAPVSLEIAQLAESLHWNPVEIYAWVKSNIKTEWYWGLMKGAEETLRQKSGNDADQAALLVALMRSAGFPSRFVHGTIEFFPNLEVAKNITGISDVQELLVFFQKAGIPCQPVIGGGKVANIQIEHIWVESQVPYANYRGVVIDEHGKSWLGLDTSIKAAGFTENTPADLPSGFDLAGFRDLYLQEVRTETPLEFLRSNLEQAGAVYDELLLTRSQSAEDLKLLPASLQFKQVAVTGEYTSLPDELKHQTRFVAKAGSETLFDITLDVMAITGRSIAIIYEPSTVEDQEIINSYGSLYNTPSYLLHLRPVFTVNGQRLAVGTSGLAVGDDFLLQVDLLAPGHTERIENRLIIGNLAVIGLAAQNVRVPDETPLQDKNGEYLLYEQALNYIDRWNQAEEELASLFHLTLARPLPTLVTLGGVVEVTWLLDMPHGFEWKGVYMDADLRAVEFSGDPESGKDFLRLSGLQGSILENRVFEDGFSVDSISTAKLLAYTNVNGLPLVVVDTSNVDTVLSGLNLPTNIVEDITHAVNQGMVVTIPQLDTLYEDWLGTGYLKEDPVTGESGWMLSGMIAGSQTAWSPAQWEEFLRNLLSHPGAVAPNADLNAGVNLRQISPDLVRSGTVGDKLTKSLQALVTDRNNIAVLGAYVTFTVKNGGGELSSLDGTITGQNNITVKTNFLGIAEVKLTLGVHTSDNPILRLHPGDTYSRQVGLNIVEAQLVNGTIIDTPFFAYGYPDKPFRIRKTDGDASYSYVWIYVGPIVVRVEDKYENPISNQTVKFTSQIPQSLTDPQACPNLGSASRALLVVKDDHCLDEWQTYANCADYAIGGSEPINTSISQITDHTGAYAGVVLGGMAQAKYSIDVTSGSLKETFNHFAWPDIDCTLDDEPKHTISFGTKLSVDAFGNEINAGPLGSVFPFESECYLIEEQTGTDGNGNNRYKIVKEFGANVGMSMSFTADEVTTGIYDNGVHYYLNQDGEHVWPETDTNGNTVYWSYSVPVPHKKDVNGNNISGIYGGQIALSSQPRAYTVRFSCWADLLEDGNVLVASNMVQVHSVGIKTYLDLFVPVDEKGHVSEDYNINYSIEPVDYKPGVTYLIIYEKEGEKLTPVHFIPESSLSGMGTVTLTRGFKFDLSKQYFVEVVLSYQTGVEILGGKVGLNFSRDKDFPKVALNPDDYYPALGAKMISLLGEKGGKIRYELATALSDGESAQLTASTFGDNWEVDFTLNAPSLAPRTNGVILTGTDTVIGKFILSDNNGYEYAEINADMNVRNNSNTILGEVLAGEAVFVLDENGEANHLGKTEANVENDLLKKFDFVEEMLNQVVPRKRNVSSDKTSQDYYRLIEEDGKFDGGDDGTVAALGIFKEKFNLQINLSDSNNTIRDVSKNDIYGKLEQDYGFSGVGKYKHILDREMLIGDNESLADYLVNYETPSNNNAGLYELYANVVRPFVDAMIAEADRYAGRNFNGAEVPKDDWVSRTGEGPVGCKQNSEPSCPGEHEKGMSYSYGGRQDVGEYNKSVSSLKAPVTIPSLYRGDVDDSTGEIGARGDNKRKWSGLINTEWEEWANAGATGVHRFYPKYWAGIDCIGLVLRTLQFAAGEYTGNNFVFPEVCVFPGEDTCNDYAPLSDSRVLDWLGTNAFNKAPLAGKAYFPIKNNKASKNKIHKGDVAKYKKHISIVYSNDVECDGNGECQYEIIHASGYDNITYIINSDGDTEQTFNRKVVVNGINSSLQSYTLNNPNGFGRIKLWE